MNNFCSSPFRSLSSFLLLYVYTRACVCTCMWRPSFCPSGSLFMRQALSLAWSLPGRLGCLASEPLESAHLCSRCWDYKPSYFLCGCWALTRVLMLVWRALPHHFYLRHFYAPKRKEILYLLFWLWRQACVVQPRSASRLCPRLWGEVSCTTPSCCCLPLLVLRTARGAASGSV